MDILVTGHRGFIGKHITSVKFIGDVRNREDIEKQIQDISGIVHLASVSNNYSCEQRILDTITTNLIGLYNVLDVALSNKLWVIFISSYQSTKLTLYGLSKLMGEELCRIYKRKGLNVRIIRLPIVYGEDDREYKVVTKIINKIKKGEEVEIHTDEQFDFMYVKDAAKLIESEVNVIQGNTPNKFTLTELKEMIKNVIYKQ